jgi:hypothetical protein
LRQEQGVMPFMLTCTLRFYHSSFHAPFETLTSAIAHVPIFGSVKLHNSLAFLWHKTAILCCAINRILQQNLLINAINIRHYKNPPAGWLKYKKIYMPHNPKFYGTFKIYFQRGIFVNRL